MSESWGRDFAIFIHHCVASVENTARESQHLMNMNEWSKPEAERLLVAPLLSISVPAPKHQITGLMAFHLCLCQAPARPPPIPWGCTNEGTAHSFRKLPNPRLSLIARLSRSFSSSLTQYPPEFDLNVVMCLWLFYLFSCSAHSTIQLYSFLSKTPISFFSGLKCLSEESAKSLGNLVPPQTTNVSPHLLFPLTRNQFVTTFSSVCAQSGFW